MVIITLQNLENPLESELTVLSSVTVGELIEFQLQQGVELLGNVTCRSATVGGIINNGSHVSNGSVCIFDCSALLLPNIPVWNG